MKKFQVISKQNCPRCETLKKWLGTNLIPYEEWPIEQDEIKKRLLSDPKFTQAFCDIDGCMVYTPIIRIDETGKYYFKELFSQMGLREKFIKELIQ